jgi:hypothetical protein
MQGVWEIEVCTRRSSGGITLWESVVEIQESISQEKLDLVGIYICILACILQIYIFIMKSLMMDGVFMESSSL